MVHQLVYGACEQLSTKNLNRPLKRRVFILFMVGELKILMDGRLLALDVAIVLELLVLYLCARILIETYRDSKQRKRKSNESGGKIILCFKFLIGLLLP
jgi:hypothetical protein